MSVLGRTARELRDDIAAGSISAEEACRMIVECYEDECWLAEEKSAAAQMGIE